MSDARYEPGQTIRFFWKISDPDSGAAVANAVATLLLTGPSGETQQPPVVEGPPGTYVATAVAARPLGFWSYLWKSTGPESAMSGRYYVVEHASPRAA